MKDTVIEIPLPTTLILIVTSFWFFFSSVPLQQIFLYIVLVLWTIFMNIESVILSLPDLCERIRERSGDDPFLDIANTTAFNDGIVYFSGIIISLMVYFSGEVTLSIWMFASVFFAIVSKQILMRDYHVLPVEKEESNEDRDNV